MKEIYQILSGSMGQELRLSQLANNLANVNTPGFRQDRAVFTDYFSQALATASGANAATTPGAAAAPGTPLGSGAATPTGSTPNNLTNLGNSSLAGAAGFNSNTQRGAVGIGQSWPVYVGTSLDMHSGPISATGRPLDVAIQDDGFFAVSVEGQSGQAYTRAGNFSVNSDHELITPSGARVLDTGGSPITVDLTQGVPKVGTDGNIMVGKTSVGKIGVVRFTDPSRLQKLGEGLLQAPADMAATPVDTPKLSPGSLEGSNVNPISSMVEMIETERAYQAQQRAMQQIDELMSARISAAR